MGDANELLKLTPIVSGSFPSRRRQQKQERGDGREEEEGNAAISTTATSAAAAAEAAVGGVCSTIDDSSSTGANDNINDSHSSNSSSGSSNTGIVMTAAKTSSDVVQEGQQQQQLPRTQLMVLGANEPIQCVQRGDVLQQVDSSYFLAAEPAEEEGRRKDPKEKEEKKNRQGRGFGSGRSSMIVRTQRESLSEEACERLSNAGRIRAAQRLETKKRTSKTMSAAANECHHHEAEEVVEEEEEAEEKKRKENGSRITSTVEDSTNNDDDIEQQVLSVQFADITVYEHPIILGDNPGGHWGPPLCIDWEKQSEVTLPLDEYETTRPERRDHVEMAIPRRCREDILKRSGYTLSEIMKGTRPVNVARAQRARTIETLSLQPFNELVEKASRTTINVMLLGSKKRKEKRFLEPFVTAAFGAAAKAGRDESPSRSFTLELSELSDL